MTTKIVPIFDPDRPFRLWSIDEIYDGVSNNVYVPNVNDGVWDWSSGLYRVMSVDIETGISTLERYRSIIENPLIDSEDILMGSVPGRVSEGYRLYLNSKTDPITAAVDSRLYVYGSDNKYIRLFKGFDISENGDVVSLYYDSNNELTDDKIPLELATSIEGSNKAIKTPLAAYATKGMVDGEVVTCVIYSDTGMVTSVNPLLVKNTSYIRNVNSANLYITHLSINSPYLTGDTQQRLEVPLNTPLENMNLTVNVHYSNGDIKQCQVDNNKITVDGLNAFRVSQKNQSSPLIVNYHFNDGEANYCATSDNGTSVSKVYQLTTLPPLSKGIVKLFIIPNWNSSLNRWDLIYYLYNLDRDICKDVTKLVRIIEPAGQGYDPLNYGTLQRLTFSLQMMEIGELEVDYEHRQNFEITLFSAMGEKSPSWTMEYVDSGNIIYGDKQFAKVSNITGKALMDISQDITSFNGWLDVMYMPLYPLYSDEETKPLIPTHVILEYKEHSVEVVLTYYNDNFEFPTLPLIGDTITCKWIKRTEARDMQLAISALSVKN